MDHGAPEDSIRHVGDLGNIEANEKGIVEVDIKDGTASLYGESTVRKF